MQLKQTIRSFISFALLASFVLSALAFGNVLPARADEGTPPPPAGEGVIIDPDIVGGAPADPGEWPWQVALIQGGKTDYYNYQFCGGSLVAPQWVVTAAHCVSGSRPTSVDVVAGIYDLVSHPGAQKRDVVQIIVYPAYNSHTHNNDIALIKLNQPVTIGGSGASTTGLIPLVSASSGDFAGINSWVTGWGATESQPNYPTELREVQVPIITNALCNDANHYNGGITSSMMCAGYELGGKDSCQGDSGGPLVVDNGNGWELAGIVSWGQGCADSGYPGVYTRVSAFSNWVNSYIQTAPTDSALILRSTGAYDGWVLESGESTDVGGQFNARNSTLAVGDNAQNKQYRSILSFDTSVIPDNATISSVTLRLRYGGIVGTNPFNTHGPLFVDIITGAFSGNNGLESSDFEAASSVDGVMVIGNTLVKNWFSASLSPGDFGLIDLAGVTQFRLQFSLDDNNDSGADFLKLFSGNAFASYRPQLIIQYTVP